MRDAQDGSANAGQEDREDDEHVNIDVTDGDLTDLHDRVRRTRWSPEWPVKAWEAGTDQAELRRLARHWVTDFNWRAHERVIESLPWASVVFDGTRSRTCVLMLSARDRGPATVRLSA